MDDNIKKFFESEAFGIVGASNNPDKFGNKVLRCLIQNSKKVFPINPTVENIEGIDCLNSLLDLPEYVKSISIITPPRITEKIMAEAVVKKIQNVWMQPGAESDLAIQIGKQHHMNVIAGGPCILVELGFRD